MLIIMLVFFNIQSTDYVVILAWKGRDFLVLLAGDESLATHIFYLIASPVFFYFGVSTYAHILHTYNMSPMSSLFQIPRDLKHCKISYCMWRKPMLRYPLHKNQTRNNTSGFKISNTWIKFPLVPILSFVHCCKLNIWQAKDEIYHQCARRTAAKEGVEVQFCSDCSFKTIKSFSWYFQCVLTANRHTYRPIVRLWATSDSSLRFKKVF